MMQRLLPEKLLGTVADAIELGALTQALDQRMAQALQALAPRRKKLDAALYAEAYREVGLPRLRSHQIDLIRSVGSGFGRSEEPTSELQSLMRISYAVFCLKK